AVAHARSPGPRNGMMGWLLPLVAAAFWGGILLEPGIERAGPAWVPIAAGLAILGLAGWLAPRTIRGSDPLVAADLVPSEPEALAMLPLERPAEPRAPPWAALATVLAFVLL